jgi:organic radical activating enzyme
MNINEIFYSIQGEGKTIGQPRVFIRLSGCNQSCSFCDTKYHKTVNYKAPQEIETHLINNGALTENDQWCITGGEPLLQQKEIINTIERYYPSWIEIETNGTINPSNELISRVDLFNISPKREFTEKNLNKLKILKEKEKLEDYIVKFVYKNKEDNKFIKGVQDKFEIPDKNVYIMPEGATKGEQKKRQEKVIRYCLKNNYNFSPRLHVLVWNKKKGV